MVKIGLVGTGTVGGGCLDIMKEHAQDFVRHYGVELEIAGMCSLEPEVAQKYGLEDVFTKDYKEIIANPDIDIVIELIGGTGIARSVVMDALQAGKHVVTANKALMATCGKEIMEAAAASNVHLYFGTSVGGGIPIIGPLKHSLTANRIDHVMGIVNGTTNYMLTRMVEDGKSYADALSEAQALGYAEANPTADVDGFDAAAKIAILASIAFNSRVTMDDVHTEGIRNITTADLEMADEMGYCVKLLAHAHRGEKGIDVRVHPTMIPKSHQLATVNGVFNAIYVIGDFVGEAMFFGEGAGAGAAASAVMGDVIEVARHIQMGVDPLVGCTCTDDLPILPFEDLETRYYIRFTVADRPGVMAAMAGVFAQHGVSLHSVMQRGGEGKSAGLVFVTHTAREKAIREVLDDIAALDGIQISEPSVIRVQN